MYQEKEKMHERYPCCGNSAKVLEDKIFPPDPDLLETIIAAPEVHMNWNFDTALGDTIREKYEHLILKLDELTAVLLHNGARGRFWIVAPQEIATILEVATVNFRPYSDPDYEPHPMGKGAKFPPIEKGVLCNRWKIFSYMDLPKNALVIGVGNSREVMEHYAVMKIDNYLL